jgi:hypothetical protein
VFSQIAKLKLSAVPVDMVSGAEKYNLYPRRHASSTHPPASTVGLIIVCPDDDRKYPSRQQWSELQRDDRIAAECANHLIPRNKFFLFPWQIVVARAALPRSCSDH